MNDTILQVKDLNVTFAAGRSIVHAVSDICFSIQKGETFALVGESGCGKSTTARAIMRLIRDPGKINSGEILFEGRDLLGMRENEIASVRGKSIGMFTPNLCKICFPLTSSAILEATFFCIINYVLHPNW